MLNLNRDIQAKNYSTIRMLLGIPLFLGLVLTTGIIPAASAFQNINNSNVDIKLNGNDFSVSTITGNRINLISVVDTNAEDIFAGFSEESDALYIRTVNHFTGPHEKPLFDMQNPSAGKPPESTALKKPFKARITAT